MSRQWVLFLTIFLVGLTSVFASSLDYVVPLSNNVTINLPCFNTNSSNGLCSGSTACSITVINSSRVALVTNKTMTNNINSFSFNLPNATAGTYTGFATCSDAGVNGFSVINFGVNEAGVDYRDSNLPWFALGTLILLFTIFLVAGSILTEGLKLAFFLLTILMIPISLWTASYFATNSFAGTAMLNILSWSYIISLSAFFAASLYVLWQLMMGEKIEKRPEYGAKIYRDRGKQ